MHTANRTAPARSRIYRYLYHSKDFCSRQDLSRALDISMPTVYQNLSGLMEDGLVGFSGELRSTGGRRASGLRVIPDVRITIGIYITRDQLQLAAVDLLLNIIALRTIDCPEAPQYLAEGRSLAEPLEAFLDDYRIDRNKLLGISVTLPAMLTEDGFFLTLCPTMQLKNLSLNGLREGIPYPFHIENNGTSGGNAEMFFREEQQNLAYLFLEDGVGGMVHIGGAPYNGDHNRSGEFGHMCVTPGGLKCSCGKNGCLEAYCSTRRISENLGISLNDFFEGVRSRRVEYDLLWNDYLQHLSIAINNIHAALDCDVVLGGYMLRYLRPGFPLLKEYVTSGNLTDHDVSFLQLGTVEEAPAPRGAALYFIRSFVEGI